MAGHPPLVENASEPGFDTGRNTRIANLTGLPSISIPNGTINMLPIGLQLIGKEFCESELLRYTAMVQNLTYN
jgi:Asp-tRNA(Asn)/Glu-tRNA(Gln) amidotransferase A subunit family amidase